jgi:hypothetical protein
MLHVVRLHPVANMDIYVQEVDLLFKVQLTSEFEHDANQHCQYAIQLTQVSEYRILHLWEDS